MWRSYLPVSLYNLHLMRSETAHLKNPTESNENPILYTKGKSSVSTSEYIADNTVKNLNLKCNTMCLLCGKPYFSETVYQLLAPRNTLRLALNNENKKGTQNHS